MTSIPTTPPSVPARPVRDPRCLVTQLHTHPSRASLVLRGLARTTLKPAFRAWPLGDRGVRALRFIEATAARLPRSSATPRRSGELGGVPTEVSLPRTPAPAGAGDAAVLYLHGGAFLFCGIATHRHVCGLLAQTLGLPIHSAAYRQLPAVGPGTSVADAYSAYLALVGSGPVPRRVVVAGDSAGGFLAAKICELAALDGAPAPAAFVGFSPQLSLDLDRHPAQTLRHDAYMPASAIRRAKPLWERGPIALRGTRTPSLAPPEIFPPTLLIAAESELVAADVLILAESLRTAGALVHTHIWRGQVHAFPVLGSLLPESRAAIGLTAEFLREVLAPASSGS